MPEADGYFEKRKHKRADKKFSVHYRLVGQDEQKFIPEDKKEVISKDISISGMQIVCDEYIEKDKMLRIDITTGTGSGPIQTFAEVRWVKRTIIWASILSAWNSWY